MSNSKYLDSLSEEKRNLLRERLFKQQEGKCFICCKDIDSELHDTDIDHIIPLVNNGKDSEINFALTHSHCNRSKLDADLNVARVLAKLEDIKVNTPKNKQATLNDVLKAFDGGKYDFKYKIEDNKIKYTFNELGTEVYESPI